MSDYATNLLSQIEEAATGSEWEWETWFVQTIMVGWDTIMFRGTNSHFVAVDEIQKNSVD